MRFYIDNGFLEYDIRGKGISLLLIHGYPLSRKIWEPQLDGLSEWATVISVDLRGHGESFPFGGPYTMDLLADDCNRLLETSPIQTPVVVGCLSMGGYVTMALYRKHPELFKGMILISTRPGPDSAEAKINREASMENAREHGATFIADSMLLKILSPLTISTNAQLMKSIHVVMASTSVAGIIGALHGMKDRQDSTALLSKISCPSLIIHGTDDQLIPITEAELMHQQIPNSRLDKIANAGHLPNLEDPSLFNQAVRDFLYSL